MGVNKSTYNLSPAEERVLSLDLKFTASNHLPNIMPRLIAGIETGLSHVPGGENLRGHFKYKLNKAAKTLNFTPNLSAQEISALKKLKKNPHISILKADKGNVTVVLDKPVVDSLILEQLNDTSQFKKLAINPLGKFVKVVKTCSLGLKKRVGYKRSRLPEGY